ncbi:MAG: redox-regulated ATPase YchF [Thermoanaerobaculia bacterium]|nr:redox-regulated ATPase YchF [Thermoanaerobaculia bacterium]
MLSVGLVGLPNVGKSTLFNALTAGEAGVSNYPFTTIDSNVGVVPVPDARLERLAELVDPEETTPCFIEFIDIAGLVEGASRGEGLGNRFLDAIRQVDAIGHVVRCFEDAEVAHVFGSVDPVRDVAVVETELLLADLELLERAMAKREKEWSTRPREHAAERQRWRRYREALGAGRALRRLDLSAAERAELRGMGLLTGRPVIYVANVGEESLEGADGEPVLVRTLRESPEVAAAVVPVSAQLESELAELDEAERREMTAELGLGESGLERLVATAFETLGLIRFYTLVSEKLRAWEIVAGTSAPRAAGKIHSDIEEGFIRARVARSEDLLEHGSWQELQRLGLVRTEGRDYAVQDGDVIEFLFS